MAEFKNRRTGFKVNNTADNIDLTSMATTADVEEVADDVERLGGSFTSLNERVGSISSGLSSVSDDLDALETTVTTLSGSALKKSASGNFENATNAGAYVRIAFLPVNVVLNKCGLLVLKFAGFESSIYKIIAYSVNETGPTFTPLFDSDTNSYFRVTAYKGVDNFSVSVGASESAPTATAADSTYVFYNLN